MAKKAGLSSSEFWSLTPWLFNQCLQAEAERLRDEHRSRAWLAWHSAILTRVKKIPTLKELVSERRKGVDEEDIKARFRAHNKSLQRNKDRNGDSR